MDPWDLMNNKFYTLTPILSRRSADVGLMIIGPIDMSAR